MDAADVTIGLTQDGQPIQVLKCGYTIAKTLAVNLSKVLELYEKSTGQTILTTEETLKKIQAITEKADSVIPAASKESK